MASLFRSPKAPFDGAIGKQMPPEITISKVFHQSFEPVAEALTVLCGSPQRAESIVARSLTQMASPRLTDKPDQNLGRLRIKSLEALGADWIPSPTPEQLRHSPLALIQSLPFAQAVAYVLHFFSGLDTSEIAFAMGSTEAGSKVQLRKATETIESRLQQPKSDPTIIFSSECEILANQVFADPEILVQVLLELAIEKREPAQKKPARRRLRA